MYLEFSYMVFKLKKSHTDPAELVLLKLTRFLKEHVLFYFILHVKLILIQLCQRRHGRGLCNVEYWPLAVIQNVAHDGSEGAGVSALAQCRFLCI